MNGDRFADTTEVVTSTLDIPTERYVDCSGAIGVHFKSNTSRLHITWGLRFTLHRWPMLGFGNSSKSALSFEFLLRLTAEVQHLLLSFHRLSPVRLQ
ncbi:hypothetical protein TNCV_207221 [Trichonephila clavipes]|nr:hypothetical protein TNCV_207221 [Trichonephila clavipes]